MPLQKICLDCKEKYIPKGRTSHYCPICRKKRLIKNLKKGGRKKDIAIMLLIAYFTITAGNWFFYHIMIRGEIFR